MGVKAIHHLLCKLAAGAGLFLLVAYLAGVYFSQAEVVPRSYIEVRQNECWHSDWLPQILSNECHMVYSRGSWCWSTQGQFSLQIDELLWLGQFLAAFYVMGPSQGCISESSEGTAQRWSSANWTRFPAHI